MSKFSFRWGVSLFDNARTEIPNIILRYYHKVPVTNIEMMFILHLASFKYEMEGSSAKPSLTKTLRERMGYKSNQGIINVEQSLVDKGLLIVKKSPGKRSEYDFAPFSEKILLIASQEESSTKLDGSESSTKLDDNQSTNIDDQSSTKLDGSRQQNLTRIREEEKESNKRGKERPPAIPAYAIFVEVTGYYGITNYWQDEMGRIVGPKPKDLDFWRKVVIGWTGKYSSKHNVEGMLDYYNRREIPGFSGNNQTTPKPTPPTKPPVNTEQYERLRAEDEAQIYNPLKEEVHAS